jgi:hypothetical protein
MVLLLIGAIGAFWLLSVSVVLGLCIAARDGDAQGQRAVRPAPAAPVGRTRAVKIALVDCEELDTPVRQTAGLGTSLAPVDYFADSAA